ncbi:hypothetical protein [Aromatoleum buckelii]|uniref:Uncharacterized protein n=1 Tax=Aromatoleum buckelii TaxID=200254 RepID=A0ABX1N7N6_9RHOO|nr:hypothetical protein [Aromatoleum buckelii]MCK0509573.1 hypothetical protein [Aromatoleum buckelii]
MRSVFYLCRSPHDPELFLFANELPENYYSPGLFVVEAINRRGMLGPNFKFLARQDRQTMSLELRRSENGRAYMVDAGHNGTFYFKAIALDRKSRYSGQRGDSFNGMSLYRLEPANMRQLERICADRDFYFIGSAGIDPNND